MPHQKETRAVILIRTCSEPLPDYSDNKRCVLKNAPRIDTHDMIIKRQQRKNASSLNIYNRFSTIIVKDPANFFSVTDYSKIYLERKMNEYDQNHVNTSK